MGGGINDIVEQYSNPSKELSLTTGTLMIAFPVVHERLWPSAHALRHETSPGYTTPGPFRERTLRSLSSCLGLLATHSLDPTRTSGERSTSRRC